MAYHRGGKFQQKPTTLLFKKIDPDRVSQGKYRTTKNKSRFLEIHPSIATPSSGLRCIDTFRTESIPLNTNPRPTQRAKIK